MLKSLMRGAASAIPGRSAGPGLFLALAIAMLLASRALAAPAEPAPIPEQELADARDMAAAYLASQIRDDGSFVYRINIDPAVKPKPKYNWLRHAGTLYALADYQQRTRDPKLLSAIHRSVDYLRAQSMAPLDGRPEIIAIWTDGKVTGAKGPKTAKLGAAGLGLVALSALNRAKPGAVPMQELRGLARFTLAMQKPNGDFYFKFTPSRGGRRDDWISLYYPGEVALGLTDLHDLDPDPQWLEGARKTLLYLARIRKNQDVVPPDHWALIATKRIWPHLSRADRILLKAHARQVVDFILSEQVWEEGSPANGGFAPDGRTTPTSTRLEGLIAAEFLFRDEPAYHRNLSNAISWGVRFMLDAQLKAGRYKGGFTRAIARILVDHPDAPAFNRRATEIRIDYVQHALSAFMQYQQFQEETR